MRNSDARAGPVPVLSGGRLCLDFINTVNAWCRPAVRDYLPDYAALADWTLQVGLFDDRRVAGLKRAAREHPADAAAAHADAIRFRRALHRVFLAVVQSASPAAADTALLNEQVRRARERQRLAAGAPNWDWKWVGGGNELGTPILHVALSGADLLCGEDLSRIKECPGPEGCGWLFYDETKNRSRRWCSMAYCGGPAKSRRFALRWRDEA